MDHLYPVIEYKMKNLILYAYYDFIHSVKSLFSYPVIDEHYDFSFCFAWFTMTTGLQTCFWRLFYFRALTHLSLSSLIKTGTTSIDNPITCLVNTVIASCDIWELHFPIKCLCFKGDLSSIFTLIKLFGWCNALLWHCLWAEKQHLQLLVSRCGGTWLHAKK